MSTPGPGTPAPERWTPAGSLECRQEAQRRAEAGDHAGATSWALLAIAADLAVIRRELPKRR